MPFRRCSALKWHYPTLYYRSLHELLWIEVCPKHNADGNGSYVASIFEVEENWFRPPVASLHTGLNVHKVDNMFDRITRKGHP